METIIEQINEILNDTSLGITSRNNKLKKFVSTIKELPFNDSQSLLETVYRVRYNIIERPTCPICGGPVDFVNKNGRLFKHYCSNECKYKSTDMVARHKEGCLKKYGVENISQLDSIKEKKEQTFLNHFGTKNNFGRKEVTETIKEKYGVDNISQLDEIKKKKVDTCLKHFGYDYGIQMSLARQNRTSFESLQKEYETKRINKTFKSSKTEESTYLAIKKKYPDVIRQYRSREYPFNCDFYIPSLDLYIECNYHWTHGGHPYNPNNEEDVIKLKQWQDKYKGKYGDTWSIRDVNKRAIAKQNNLNYVEIWNADEIEAFLNRLSNDEFRYNSK